jgi:hypothetical protein
MKKEEYKIKQPVWIHMGESKLVGGRVVEVIDLVHLKEGYSEDNELYVIEIPSSIEPIYEVRTWEQISPTAKGPINLFTQVKDDLQAANRMLKKIGIVLPDGTMATNDTDDFDVDGHDGMGSIDEPTPEQIHAAMERAEQANRDGFTIETVSKTKPRFNNRKKTNAKRPRRAPLPKVS